MGRPLHVKPLASGTNRRNFLKQSLPAAVAATPGGVFQHGVASGDPLSDRVILWTRVTPPAARATVVVSYIIATDPDLLAVVARGSSKTNIERDFTVKIDADLQEVHRQHPMVAIWDDHEIANDSWIDGAENHTEGAEGTWTQRAGMGLQAYYEWMPVRVVDPTQKRRSQRAFEIGDLVDLVMLEERLSARSRQLPATLATPFGNGFVQAGSTRAPPNCAYIRRSTCGK